MLNVAIPFAEIKDAQGKVQPELHLGRDPQRTPMQWDDTQNAGFTSGEPWLRIAPNYVRVNVASEKEEKDSLLMLYRRLLQLRGKEDSLSIGEYIPVFADSNILAYVRAWKGADSFLVVLNVSVGRALYEQRNLKVKGKIEVATNAEREREEIGDIIALEGGEGILVRLEEAIL
jgi:alpha-glucosidase